MIFKFFLIFLWAASRFLAIPSLRLCRPHRPGHLQVPMLLHHTYDLLVRLFVMQMQLNRHLLPSSVAKSVLFGTVQMSNKLSLILIQLGHKIKSELIFFLVNVPISWMHPKKYAFWYFLWGFRLRSGKVVLWHTFALLLPLLRLLKLLNHRWLNL